MVNLPFLDNPIFGRSKRPGVNTNSAVMLTPQGKENADTHAYSGTKNRIIIHINESGSTMLVREIALDLSLPIDHVKGMIDILIQRGDMSTSGV